MKLGQKIIQESEKNFNITLGTNPGIGNPKVDLIRITLGLEREKSDLWTRSLKICRRP
jgi:hypothetical protein